MQFYAICDFRWRVVDIVLGAEKVPGMNINSVKVNKTFIFIVSIFPVTEMDQYFLVSWFACE